jgi:hypothetical protein
MRHIATMPAKLRHMLESGNKLRATTGQAARGSLPSLQQGESAPTGTAIAELSLGTAAKLTANKRCISSSTPLIRLKRIYNFLCSMLVLTPFALSFVTLRGVFMHFPELTY